MKYAEKYGVSRASRKYNKSRSYIYFRKQHWDGSAESLVCQSRRPHSHPNQHTEAKLGIRHKLIRSYMPRHNNKIGRNHWDDQKRFYSCHEFYSLEDFAKQLAVLNCRTNNLPMSPLHRLPPKKLTVQYV